jgi:SAM-dependent methyltransferase
MTDNATAFGAGFPPDWALRPVKPLAQHLYDLLGAPLRMLLLPDASAERLHLTSLRAERLSRVLRQLRGRCLDIGAGDNMLLRLYARQAGPDSGAKASIGVDVVDWGGGCQLIESSARLPFPDASFDTVTFVACLNHIPERQAALAEARRVLRPNGRLLATMIGRKIGAVGHALWWYSEDKHRDVATDEEPGLDHGEMLRLIADAGFAIERVERFVYGLNRLYIATRQ